MAAVQQPLSLHSVVCASANQVSTRVGTEGAILDLDTSTYYGLDSVGARIFELLQEPTPLETVLDKIVAEFEVDAPRAGTDLLALVAELIDRNLVELRSAG
jgi:hypothetical protein